MNNKPFGKEHAGEVKSYKTRRTRNQHPTPLMISHLICIYQCTSSFQINDRPYRLHSYRYNTSSRNFVVDCSYDVSAKRRSPPPLPQGSATAREDIHRSQGTHLPRPP